MKQYYIIITPFFPDKNSFRGVFIYDQAKAIERNSNYQVVVFKPKSLNSKEKDYIYNGIQVHFFYDIQMPSYILNGLTNGFNNFFFLYKLKKSGINIDDIKIAHAHTARFASFPLTLKKENHNIKTLVQHHDPDPLNIRNGFLSLKKWNAVYRTRMSTHLFNQIDCHICISNFVADSLCSFPGPPKNLYLSSYKQVLNLVKSEPSLKIKNLYILYNGVDTSIFYPNKKQTNTVFTIGCIANFVDWKSQETLIYAINILKKKQLKIKTIFIGSGPTLQTCINLAKTLNLTESIEFKKEVHHQELATFYNNLDLFVLPSYFEGFGCVFTEAAACGIPYIICKHQGASEYIPETETNLWTFTPKNYSELAYKIEYYMKKKPEQHLNKTLNINILIKDFIAYLNQL